MKKIILIISVLISVLVKAQSYTIMTTNYEWRNKNKYTRVDTVRSQDTSLLVLGSDSLLRYVTLSQLKAKADVRSFWDTTGVVSSLVGRKVLSNTTVTIDSLSNIYSMPVAVIGGSDTTSNFGLLIKGSSGNSEGIKIEASSNSDIGLMIEADGATDDIRVDLANGKFTLNGLQSGSIGDSIVTINTLTNKIRYISSSSLSGSSTTSAIKDTIIYLTDTLAIQNSFSNPIQILPAISGKAYNPISCNVVMTYNGSAYDFTMNQLVIGQNSNNWFNNSFIAPEQTSNRWYSSGPTGTNIQMLANTPVYLFAGISNATVGSSTFKVHLYYTIEEQ